MLFDHVLHLLATLLTPTVLVAVLVYDVLLITTLVALARRFRRRRAAAAAGPRAAVAVCSGYRGDAPEIVAAAAV